MSEWIPVDIPVTWWKDTPVNYNGDGRMVAVQLDNYGNPAYYLVAHNKYMSSSSYPIRKNVVERVIAGRIG